VEDGGRAITTMPDTWKEAKAFKKDMLSARIEKKLILKKKYCHEI
jgi:hypothetical protein